MHDHIGLFVGLFIFFTLGIAFTIWRDRVEAVRRKTEGVDIAGEANDPELTGTVTTVPYVDYPGSMRYEGGPAIARYDSRDADGRLTVTKWVLARKGAYFKRRGHDVLYEYFREDGSLESDWLVNPEADLGGGIYSKERRRYFEGDKECVREVWTRADGTVGLISDHKTGVFQHIRLDGKSLHSEYFDDVLIDGKAAQKSRHYCLDGKTLWIEKDLQDNVRVYFDLDGNPVDLRFKRENAIGSYSMGPDCEPLLTGYDKYLRVALDGSLVPDYDQTWFVRWDANVETIADTLGAVAVYDTYGRVKTEYRLELLPPSEPRFIKEVVQHNFDGSTLVRKYRSPGCRSIEILFDPGLIEVKREEFGEDDVFYEDIDEVPFQGFLRNVRGTYDDESQDF